MSDVRSWEMVAANLERIAAESAEPFETDTIVNGRELVDFLRSRFAPPEISQGYWPTFQIWWLGGLGLEVFADRIEVYPPSGDREPLKVWYEPHTPGSPFSEAFIADLVAHARP